VQVTVGLLAWAAAVDEPIDMLGLVGLEIEDPKVIAVIERHDLELDDSHDGRLSWENEKAGVALVQEGDDKVGTIFLYGGGKDGFARFEGPLPFGLTFGCTRGEVRAEAGDPTKVRGASGDDGGSDRYDTEDSSVHFAYDAHEDRIVLVTLMSAGHRPD
jgi:hypothetical protein